MAESPQHQRLVAWLARDLRRRGALVTRASLPDWPRPPSFYGFEPDVVAKRGGVRILGEAECADALDSSHTAEQLLAFAWEAEHRQTLRTVVVLAVPRAARRAALELVDDLVLGDLVRVLSPTPPPARARARSRPGPIRLLTALPRPTEQELRAAAMEHLFSRKLRQRA
jgi:hypothetical protein